MPHTESLSKEYEFDRITEQKGLSSNIATCVFQDYMGFIWIGTANGLNLYTGEDFYYYKHDITDTTSISDNNIFYIAEDADNSLWVSTSNGLNRYIREKDCFDRFYYDELDSSTISHDVVRYLYRDKNNNFWITTRKGLNKLVVTTSGKFEFKRFFPEVTIPEKNQEKELSMFSMVDDSSGNIWTGSWGGGLIKFNPNSRKFKHYRHEPGNIQSISSNIVRYVTMDHKGLIWIGTYSEGINIFDPKTETFKNYRNTPSLAKLLLGETNILTIMHDSKRNTWIGGNGSLHVIDPRQMDLLLSRSMTNGRESIGNNGIGRINHIYEDNDGNIWIASSENAVELYDHTKDKFSKYRVSWNNMKGKDHISSFAVDTNGHTWISTYENGLLKTTGKKVVKRISYPLLHNKYLNHMVIDPNQRLWLGGREGIELYDPQSDSVIKYFNTSLDNSESLSYKVINKFIIDTRNILWILTREGINYINLKDDDLTLQPFKHDLELEKIYDIYEDQEHRIIFCGQGGVAYFAPEVNEVSYLLYDSKNPKGLSNNIILCAIQDEQERYWFGTYYGLNMYDREEGTFKVWYEKDGLASAIIYDIEYMDNGLWLRTGKGISHLNPSKKKIRNYFTENGLPEKIKILWKSPDRKLFISGESEYVRFDPIDIKDTPNLQDIYFTGLKINGQKVEVGKNSVLKKHITLTNYIELKQDKRTIEISFSALNYNQAERNLYQYMLEGFDTSWHYLGTENRVLLMNLPSGSYTLKVKGSTNSTIWGDKAAKLDIDVLPPWWLTPEMYVLYLVVIIIIWLVALRIRRKRDDLLDAVRIAKEDVRVNEEKARLLHEADEQKLIFFTNISHEFRTPLTLISIPLESLQNEELPVNIKGRLNQIESNTKRLEHLINQLIDFRKLSSNKIRIKPQQVELIGFIRNIYDAYVPLSDNRKVDYSFKSNTSHLNTTVDVDILDIIINNLLSNAFKNTKENGKVFVQVDSKVDFLYIRVSNSGKGILPENLQYIFERFYHMSSSNVKKMGSSGIGLAIVKEYVQLLKGNIEVESEPDKMTTFSVKIPLNENVFIDVLGENIQNLPGSEQFNSPSLLQEDMVQKNLTDAEGEDDLKSINNVKILLAEDDEELRIAICKLFEKDFEIIEAVDGKSAFSLAKKFLPDIIISDIMMPVMDGIEFCKRCKNDTLTSHIPIVLLTAKAGKEAEISGYSSGADAFVTKPFSIELLKTIINNLIETRKKLKELYADNHYANIDTTYSNDYDKSLIKKVKNILETNIQNDKFNANMLAKELNMSIAQLHRKFNGFIGTSPGNYIRTFKLNTAKKMIMESNLSISEISYLSGFKHPSHFSRSFHKEFGTSPANFKAENR